MLIFFINNPNVLADTTICQVLSLIWVNLALDCRCFSLLEGALCHNYMIINLGDALVLESFIVENLESIYNNLLEKVGQE